MLQGNSLVHLFNKHQQFRRFYVLSISKHPLLKNGGTNFDNSFLFCQVCFSGNCLINKRLREKGKLYDTFFNRIYLNMQRKYIFYLLIKWYTRKLKTVPYQKQFQFHLENFFNTSLQQKNTEIIYFKPQCCFLYNYPAITYQILINPFFHLKRKGL